MSSENRIFHPIPRSVERDLILSDVAATLSDVYLKLTNNKTLLSKALKWFPPFKLQLTYPEGPRPMVNSSVAAQMNCRGEKYFAMVYVQDTGSQLFLVVEGAIYRLQRRQSFRLKLPSDYPVVAKIFEVNGHKMDESVRVLDLSEGGCSLSVPRSLAGAMGAYIGLEMRIGARGHFTEYGHIRYLKAEKGFVRLGVRFDTDNKQNTELFNLTRDLYVELFSKWSRRR